MRTEALVNGETSIIITPENDMEIAILKSLLKQEVLITEINAPVTVLTKTHANGIILSKKPRESKENLQ